ncbi:MAG: hypothetical protein IJO71_09120 [Microbacterium sp.]|uniref:hypothetical protein n=1 Tax=Microbacterium sp. TaxID=51671 RepID=UPI0025EAF1AE|nr:hypothetical protein [Microbacterium sp.]MBQ9917346.1 hypothetical protein [Microbacterium sp.]
MIPPEIQAQLEELSLLQFAVLVVAIVAAGWALWRAATWIVTKFFPGVVSGAQGILAVAQVLAAAKDLPEFMESTKRQLGEVHHEVHFNNGGSVKDAVIRVERTSERLEEGVLGLHGRLEGVDSSLATVVNDIADLRTADAALREDINNPTPRKNKEQM